MSNNIDIKQQEVKTLRESRESPLELRQRLEKYRALFDDTVDAAQAKIDTTGKKLTATEAKSVLTQTEDRIADYLGGVAIKGAEILNAKNEKTPQQLVSIDELSASLRRELVGLESKTQQAAKLDFENQLAVAKQMHELAEKQSGDQQFQALDETLLLYGNIRRDATENTALAPADRQKFLDEISTSIQKINQQKLYSKLISIIAANKWDEYVQIQIDQKTGAPAIKFTPSFKLLPPEEKTRIVTALGAARDDVTESSAEMTHEKITENFWLGRKLFREGELLNAKKYLEQFLQYDIKSEKFQKNKELKTKETEFTDSSNAMLEIIKEAEQTNADFLQAQKFAAEGDLIQAKKLFKLCLAHGPSDKKDKAKVDPEYTPTVETELRKIALRQALEAQARLTAMQTEKKEKEDGSDISAQQTEREISIDKQLQVIQKITTDIEAGKFLDYEDALKAYETEISKIDGQAGEETRMRDELVLSRDLIIAKEGRKGYLTLGRKYRQIGDTKEAEKYFRMYFNDKIETAKTKTTTVESIRREYEEKPKFAIMIQEQITKFRENYEEEAKKSPNPEEWKKAHPFNEKILRDNFIQLASQKIQQEEVLKNKQRLGLNKPEHFATPEEEQAWGEFMSMKGYHRIGTSTEIFELSDDNVRDIINAAVIEMPLIAISGVGAGIAARAVAKGVLKKGITETSHAYLAMQGALTSEKEIELMMQMASRPYRLAATVGTKIAETTAFTAVYGPASFSDSTKIQDTWLHVFSIYSTLGATEKLAKALKIGKISSGTVDFLALGSIDNQLTQEELAILGAQPIEESVISRVAKKAKRK